MSKFEAYSDGSACLVVEPQERDAFKELIQRGANLWPDAPPAIKVLADLITNDGVVMQDYYKQAGVPVPGQEKPAEKITVLEPAGNPPLNQLIGQQRYPGQVVNHMVYVPSIEENMAYSTYVARNTKDMGSHADDLMHATIGLVGEAGEIADAIKKHWAYGKKLDRENVKEELGDILFYLTNLLRLCDMTLEEVLDANVAKLDKRYPGNRYTNEAAIARADKQAPLMGSRAESLVMDDVARQTEFVSSDHAALQQFKETIVREQNC